MTRHRWNRLALLGLAALCAPALAKDINQLQTLSQTEFHAVVEDLGAAISYKPLMPTAPLGTTGFDIGVGVTGTKLKHQELFERATSDGDFPSTLVVPTVRASKGLPWGFDA